MPLIIASIAIVSCLALLLVYRSVHIMREWIQLDRQALDTATNGVLYISAKGRILAVSRMAEKTFSIKPHEVLGEDIRQLIAPADNTPCADSGYEYLRVNTTLIGHSPAGDSFPVSVRLCRSRVKGSLALAVLVCEESRSEQLSDSLRQYAEQLKLAKESLESHNRQLEKTVQQRTAELQEAKLAAEEANEFKGTFLANVSHELRTPLHGILSFSRFGVRKIDEVPHSKLLHYFKRIEESGTTLLALIDELLDLAKLESGRCTLVLKEIEVNELVDNVVESFSGLAQERRVKINTHAVANKMNVKADGQRIAQVLRNLIGNALRVAPQGSDIDVVLSSLDGNAVVSVYDRGPGIPEDEMECIFEKFVQSSDSTSHSGGTGLGLAICHEIVDMHDGWIRAGNRPDGGAIFAFSVPLACCTDQVVSASLPEFSLVECLTAGTVEERRT